ncbi:DNA adenine methylase [Aurantibacillus circumpalustris]|uniref:DNA adenine methylase n=1 Tax=Aurantibacillus circumpalustris TaxID=3036359 RepID=UPI00295ADBED|nr:DNA adenine methylase [Aurantibacillus circumpalustris]
MKTPITYYGGKQKLAATILKLIPTHKLYCEPFIGGAAIFFAKEPSAVEVINDVNSEMINFYRVVQNDFISLEKHIRITLHSRQSFREASVIYNNPQMFNEIQRAWAVWCLASQGFAGIIDGSWGYDIVKNTTTKKISNKRSSFTEDYAIRLQNVQIECTDALRIISSRDNKDAFFYCDPPYFNSDCAHYDGYSLQDFENLLKMLAGIKGKFLLSSYPSPILKSYIKAHKWHSFEIKAGVSVANNNSSKGQKIKTEVLTANYPIKL